MPSDVSICNRALHFLGADPIISLMDDSKAGRLCLALFADIRDAVLQSYPWNCAIARASLPANLIAPSWGFAHAYNLPAGPDPGFCLRVLEIEGEIEGATPPYRIEGRRIHTDAGPPLNLLYIGRVTDATLLPPLLAEAISARLAVDLAGNLTESAGRIDLAREWAFRAMGEARATDAQEGTPGEFNIDTWLQARL